MDEYNDPFSVVYAKLWEVAEASQSLQTLVRVGNRIQFVKDYSRYSDPRKAAPTPGTTPELMLIPDFCTPRLQVDNYQGQISRIFSWTIRTSERMLNKALFPVEWALYSVLKENKKEFLKLEFNGQRFVQNIEFTNSSAVLPDYGKQDMLGWRSLWDVEVTMGF